MFRRRRKQTAPTSGSSNAYLELRRLALDAGHGDESRDSAPDALTSVVTPVIAAAQDLITAVSSV